MISASFVEKLFNLIITSDITAGKTEKHVSSVAQMQSAHLPFTAADLLTQMDVAHYKMQCFSMFCNT